MKKRVFLYLLGLAMFIVGFYLFKQWNMIGSVLMVLGGGTLVTAASSK
ncbi:hypothetical protein [Psychrobacillus sp. OK032]|nr:hypothetical protein [Psychrobacillus sp. OK032]SES17401.1 hypothetical protein SAMN05518872_10589 [Psychrobacillus sp. OK032]